MSETTARNLFWLAAFVVSMLLVFVLKDVLTPFIVAALIAYLGDPIADRLELKGLSRTSSVIVIFVVMTLLLILSVILLIPMISSQLNLLKQSLPNYIEWIQLNFVPWLQNYFGIDESSQLLDQIKSALNKNWQTAGDVVGIVIGQLTRSSFAVAAWIGTMALIPVVAFYMLRDWDIFIAHIRDLLPLNKVSIISSLSSECDSVLGAFLRGQLLIMVLLGMIYAIGLTIAGIDLSLLLGMVAGLASVVPYLGVIVGIVASGSVAMFQYHDWIYLLPVLAVFGVGQMLESMFLTPVLVGDKIGMHPVAVIFAVLAGGQLFGFVGILLALPVAAVAMVLIRHMHRNYKSSVFYHDESELQIAEAKATADAGVEQLEKSIADISAESAPSQSDDSSTS